MKFANIFVFQGVDGNDDQVSDPINAQFMLACTYWIANFGNDNLDGTFTLQASNQTDEDVRASGGTREWVDIPNSSIVMNPAVTGFPWSLSDQVSTSYAYVRLKWTNSAGAPGDYLIFAYLKGSYF